MVGRGRGGRKRAVAGQFGMSDPVTLPRPNASAPKPHGWQPWRWLSRTPVRTFFVYPIAVATFELVRHDGTLPLTLWGIPLLLWGYLQYRLVGRYRGQSGGGGPGLERPPQRLVTTGLYRYTRNPMYLGHLIFMTGLAITFRSWLAVAILVINAAWFDWRVRGDETRLRALFGQPYDEYCRRVKRWIPGLI
jgi:protein-S-isoprenylcysteine O-methyltransferase Ste14